MSCIVGDDRTGAAETIVFERLESFEDGNHIITYNHNLFADSRSIIACGEIPKSL